MDKKQAEKRIKELRKTVEYHAKKYYDDDKPEISDFEYDMLMVELRNLEKEFPDFKSKESLTQKEDSTENSNSSDNSTPENNSQINQTENDDERTNNPDIKQIHWLPATSIKLSGFSDNTITIPSSAQSDGFDYSRKSE